MKKISGIKGTFDILPENAMHVWASSFLWNDCEHTLRKVAQAYCFSEIRTPILEHEELFTRSVGESSDVVTKEMYTLKDKGERCLVLRPEGTASVIRSFVEHLSALPLPQKLFYIGPMFRYERPQKGRFRQMHQFGVELIGGDSVHYDIEIIHFLVSCIEPFFPSRWKIHINSLGDVTSRQNYCSALKSFLEPHYHSLSSDSQNRFQKNILRILDSKDPDDQNILKNSPAFQDYLSEDAKKRFSDTCSWLTEQNIPFVIDPKLVRGLDYYDHTVFEIVHESAKGLALGGGGRYSALVKALGGPSISCIGFALGLDRILQLTSKENTPPTPELYFIPIGEQAEAQALALTLALRKQGHCVEVHLQKKRVKQGLQIAIKMQVPFVIILGESELNQDAVTIKHMRQEIEVSCKKNALSQFLNSNKFN